MLANPAIIESLLFGQQAFAWGAALLLFGIACWRRGRRFTAAILVGLGQATHAPIVLPIGLLLVVDRHVGSSRTAGRCCATTPSRSWWRCPPRSLVFASPGYADSSERDRLVNFVGTLAPRLLVIALPFLFVWLRSMPASARSAPLAVVVMLATNVALQEPLNVAFQWRAVTRSHDVSTASLDNFLRSAEFEPGATYRVLRGAGDGKLGLYHVLLAGGRLDSEMFPESMAIRNFANLAEYERLLCDASRRLRDRVRQLHLVETHQRDRDCWASSPPHPHPAPARPPCGCTRSSAGRATSCTRSHGRAARRAHRLRRELAAPRGPRRRARTPIS